MNTVKTKDQAKVSCSSLCLTAAALTPLTELFRRRACPGQGAAPQVEGAARVFVKEPGFALPYADH